MAARSDSTSHSPGTPTVPGAGEEEAEGEVVSTVGEGEVVSTVGEGEVVLTVGEGEVVLMAGEGEVVVAAVVAIAVAVEAGQEAECGLVLLLLLKVEKLRSNVVPRLRPHLPFLRHNIF